MKNKNAEGSSSNFQHAAVAEELIFLRRAARELAEAYVGQLEGEIAALVAAVKGDAASARKLPTERAHDLRDMLSLLQNLDLRPAKGRRRDLKKIETLLQELRQIAERWN